MMNAINIYSENQLGNDADADATAQPDNTQDQPASRGEDLQ